MQVLTLTCDYFLNLAPTTSIKSGSQLGMINCPSAFVHTRPSQPLLGLAFRFQRPSVPEAASCLDLVLRR